LPEELRDAVERTRSDYERWLDARYAAARGHCDALIDPLDTRKVLNFALRCCGDARRGTDSYPPTTSTAF
jgi:acetyl-CoA carboxylase carboxyltransferase component